MYDLADGYDEWLERLDALNDERTEPAPTPTVERTRQIIDQVIDRFNDRQCQLAQTVSDERMDEIETGTNKTPFKAYEFSAMCARADARQGRPFTKSDAERVITRIRSQGISTSRVYAHRSHHHQAGEE